MRDKFSLFSPSFIPWKVDASEVRILKTLAEEPFELSTCLLLQLPSSLTEWDSPAYLGMRMRRGHLPRNAVTCSVIPDTPWLALCELRVLCHFLIAPASLFFLLSAGGKRFEKIIAVLLNGRGIFSVIKLALLKEGPVCICQEIQGGALTRLSG